MDNFQAIGQLVIKAQDLLDSIKGGAIRVMQAQFDALKVRFNDKLSATQSELNSFISVQKAQVNSIFSNPDSRYQKIQPIVFKVEGDEDKFYPIVFDSTNVNRTTKIKIGRYVNQGGQLGSMYCTFKAVSRSWGGRSATMILEVLKTTSSVNCSAGVINDGFIGSYTYSNTHPSGCVVWVRGSYEYEFLSEGALLSDVVSTDDKTFNPNGAKAVIYMNGYDREVNGYTTVLSVLTERNAALIPNFTNYEGA